MALYRRLLLTATLLAFAVIALGAYVRLSDAGLGCPDWPGCYGHWLGVPDAAHEQLAAQEAFPKRPLDTGKAWKEMVHRYLAGTLGLLILTLCLLAWRREIRQRHPPTLATLLLAIVCIQAALGMWTVTLLLKPAIVTLHLIGGMTTLSLLVGLNLASGDTSRIEGCGQGTRILAAGALLAIIVQIGLGAWVSSNYAALACPDFPLCQGQWRPNMDFGNAFSAHRELGMTTDGRLLPIEALTAIHWAHRLGAIVVTATAGALAIILLKTGKQPWQAWGWLLSGLIVTQIILGIANVLLALPLVLAVTHTLGAACLLTATLVINIQINPSGRQLMKTNSQPLDGS